MQKPIFTTGRNSLAIAYSTEGDGIALMFGELFSEPSIIHIETKEEFTALVGELYRMWDKAQEVKSA